MPTVWFQEATCDMLAEDGLSDSLKQLFPIKQIFLKLYYFNRTLFHLCKFLAFQFPLFANRIGLI